MAYSSGNPEDRVADHGNFILPILKADGIIVSDFAFAQDHNYCARDVSLVNILLKTS
jgi:hypothetical protein